MITPKKTGVTPGTLDLELGDGRRCPVSTADSELELNSREPASKGDRQVRETSGKFPLTLHPDQHRGRGQRVSVAVGAE